MYLTHFGLARHPFRTIPDPTLFYGGGHRGTTLESLVRAVTDGDGIVKVIGGPGSGKTMLCRMLETRLPDTAEVVCLTDPAPDPGDILHAIAVGLKLPVTRQTEQSAVVRQLQSHLLERRAGDRQVVVLVEEAQAMPLDTLEAIRLLSNLETSQGKLLPIVLFGQPELDRHLADRRIRQLRERITHRFRLDPLTPADTGDYIRFRLHTAGCGLPDLFTPAAVRRIARASGGLVRRINRLADKALLAAFAEQTYAVTPRHVRTAIRDSEFRRPLPLARIGTPVGAIGALALAGWLLWPGRQATENVPPRLSAIAALTEEASAAAMPIGVAISSVSLVAATPPPTPPVAAQQSEPAVTPNKILLERRVASTLEWLHRAEGKHYTIQLMTCHGSTEPLEALLAKAREADLLDQVYVYPAVRGDPEMWVAVYGAYPGVTPAAAAIAGLPGTLSAYRPFVRNVSAVLTESGAASHRDI